MLGKKPQVTIIFVADREVVRLDFGRQAAVPTYQFRSEVDAESSLVQSIGLVLQGQPRVGQRVVVLSTTVWSQVLFLPAMSVQGISREELAEALKFEAETLSGLEIDDIAISFLAGERSEDQQKYWVSVFSQIELTLLTQSIQNAGGRVVQVMHPAGAGRLEANLGERQVEFWDRSCFIFEAGKRILGRVQVSNDESICNPETKLIFGPENEIGTEPVGKSIRTLAKEVDLFEWASGIAVALEGTEVPFAPVLQVVRRTVATPVRHLISLLLAIVIGAFCVWHWFFVSGQNNRLRAEIVKIQEPARKKKKYNSELATILENRNKVAAEAEEVGDQLKRVQFFIDYQKDRFAQLLDLLVELRTDELVIGDLGASEEGVSISGVSLSVESAQAFAKRLRENAVGMGWVVNPAKQEGRQQMTSGGPWDFEILLTDTGPFEKTAFASTRKTPTPTN